MIKINTTELMTILRSTPTDQNIMLVGKHGIGKSEIIQQYFLKKKQKVVTLFLGQMSDPGDLIGLPYLDDATKRTEFRPPFWFPENNEPIVLFLDELNRARPEILQSVMDLTLNKKLANRSLPKESQIIVAINEGDEYQLTDLDPALVSRFNIYQFSPTVQEWLLWATENKIDSRIIDFIDKNRDSLDSTIDYEQDLKRSPDRRAWHRVSEIISNIKDFNRTTEKMVAGIIGIPTTVKFFNFIKMENALDIRKLFSNFLKNKSQINKMKTHDLANLNEGLFRILETEENQETLQKFVQNTEEYIRYLSDNKLNEALAHWTTLYNSDYYPKSKVAILMHSPYIYDNIVNFIKNIDL